MYGDRPYKSSTGSGLTRFADLESAIRALPANSRRGVSTVLLRALINPCRDFRAFVRNSPVPILPVPYQLGWDEELRTLCLDSVKVLSTHLSAVIAELKTLAGDPDVTRRHQPRSEWPEDAYHR